MKEKLVSHLQIRQCLSSLPQDDQLNWMKYFIKDLHGDFLLQQYMLKKKKKDTTIHVNSLLFKSKNLITQTPMN